MSITLSKEEKAQLTKVRQAKLEILFTSRDPDGNFLIYNMGHLYLRQDGEDRNRKIGNIYYVNDILLYVKWETQKNIFNKMDAWSVPLLIAKNVDVIWFRTPEREYWITKEKARELLKSHEAAIMKFEGMEKKLYIPRKLWSEKPVIEYEKHDMTMLAGYTVKQEKPNMKKYINRVGESWAKVLYEYFEKPYMQSVATKLKGARESKIKIYPESKNVFRAFRETPYDKVKVVIIGQDPYHDGSATGLAFDCSTSKELTPSMQKISEGFNSQFPDNFDGDGVLSGNLSKWAEEGVLLLNAALTVRKGKPGSHLKQWAPFTREVVLELNGRTNIDKGLNRIVYLLWGSFAQQFKILISDEHPVIECEHPVAAAYKNRKWVHNDCFRKANRILKELGVEPIKWH